MDELVADFIAETRETLEALDLDLVRLEQQPNDADLLGRIFRLIHTTKGNCGFLGLVRLQAVAHSAENVLGAFRQGELEVTADAITAILDAIKTIRWISEQLAASGVEPEGDDSAMIARLDAIFANAGQPAGQGQSAAVEAPPAPSAVEPAQAPPTMLLSADDEGDTLIVRLGGRPGIDAACRTALERVTGSAFGPPERQIVQRGLCDGLCSAARGSETAEEFAARMAAARAEWSEAPTTEALLDAVAAAFVSMGARPTAIQALLTPIGGAPELAATVTASHASLASQAPPIVAPAAPPSAMQETESAAAQTIRVNVDALEQLMTVVSELVLIRNQLIQTLRGQPESPFAAPLNRLNQVTSDLQERVMTTRMQPISGAWAKLPRLVRDLANELGKKIDLTMWGQETELDRQVMELIKDPLTHMIRNAADHGLETPEERAAAGKSQTGRISLAARHEGGAIVIEISDDGRGLSSSRIRAKAVSNGLITQAQADAMSDAEAHQLIFQAGLSTAQAVTSVSGRGVGMDVVRSNIEKIGGAIELSSVEGKGCLFTIRIPLTLTIVSALIVECCGERFAMPQSSVTELVSANEAAQHRIEYIEGAAVMRLRDRLLPLLFLQKLLSLDEALCDPSETCVVVARVGSFSFGVVVDRVFDTEEIVVKPMATVLRHLKVYNGATILGDGAVIPILDFKGVSIEAGASQSGALSRQADEDETGDQSQPRQTVLVFRSLNRSLKGAPLSQVARIEEIGAEQIERVDGRTVVQYLGKLMPVLSADDQEVAVWSGETKRPLLVFSRDDRHIGLLADEIVDIVETLAQVEIAGSGRGAAGSLIIEGAATELIDVDYYWRQVGLGGSAGAGPSSGLDERRLLLIDDSPFSRMLIEPLLGRAGYHVTVAPDVGAALALHGQGRDFELIMADLSDQVGRGRWLRETLSRADRWHDTPLLGLGMTKLGDSLERTEELPTVAEAITPCRGAA